MWNIKSSELSKNVDKMAWNKFKKSVILKNPGGVTLELIFVRLFLWIMLFAQAHNKIV